MLQLKTMVPSFLSSDGDTAATFIAVVVSASLLLVNNPEAYPWGIFSVTGNGCHQRRQRVLIWLYSLGKFTIVDTYAIVLVTMVAYRVHMELQDYVVDLFVSPVWKYYCLLGFAIAGLTISHIMVRREGPSRKSMDHFGESREALLHHGFRKALSGVSRWHLSSITVGVLVAGFISSAVLIVTGANQECFIFELEGLSEVFADGRQSHISTHSYLNLVSLLSKSSYTNTSLSVWLFQALFYFFGMLLPVSCYILLLILLFWPLTSKSQSFVFSVAETCSAWSWLEALLISFWAATVHLSHAESFIPCDVLQQLSTANSSITKVGIHWSDGNCIRASARVGENAGYLICGVVLNYLLSFFVLRLAHQALHEKQSKQEGIEELSCGGDCREKTFVEVVDDFSCGMILERSVDPVTDKTLAEVFEAVPLVV